MIFYWCGEWLSEYHEALIVDIKQFPILAAKEWDIVVIGVEVVMIFDEGEFELCLMEGYDKLIFMYLYCVFAGEIVPYLLDCLAIFVFVSKRVMHFKAEKGKHMIWII
jgi:hypothetical protein